MTCVVLGFCCEADENCVLLGYYAACSDVFLLFQDNLSVPLKMGPIGCPRMSVKNCHYMLRNIPEEHSSHLIMTHFLFISITVTE